MTEHLGLAIETDSGLEAASFRLAVTDAAALRAFCSRVLGPLADERHTDLRRTLEEYIRAHGSQSSVSRNLYLHRNTVRQRLRRIEELTGAALGDPDERLMLQLALLGLTELERTRRSA
jgi:DNA-binding PucR family transcriptional regulator